MMSVSIEVSNPTCIDGESLKAWLINFLSDTFEADTLVLQPDTPWDCTGQSAAFAAVDVDVTLSKAQLLARGLPQGNYTGFYIHDVVAAACHAGALTESYYHVYHSY
ncbi:MAG: hypothetical protein GY833_10835 [Aestuariibacter sp.]|nr:hypothetical protein [Aestuariibacter sp.]